MIDFKYKLSNIKNKIKEKVDFFLFELSMNKVKLFIIGGLSIFALILTVYLYYYLGGKYNCWKKFGEIEQGYKYSVISGCKVKTSKGFIPEGNYNFRDNGD